MPPTIKILPQTLANKIAAGEVVQRPASAVKELLENSIDAGARSLTIIIKDGGKSLIHVIDDGCGMNAEDALLSFERHATSKIATYDDLENIRTLGFRGEALASIAAVAQIELRTRQAGTDVGAKIRIDGGVILEQSPDAMHPGTSVLVRNLFYNTPGRRKFLKSALTEFKHISDAIQRVALSHPNLSIKLVSDDEVVYDLQPTDPERRIKEIFGEKVSKSVFAFREENDLASLSGFLGKPDFTRKARTEQYLFLNKRYVLNRNLNHAVFQAYEHLIEKGSFPLFVLFLTINPKRVDVNVHPSKMEVKFEDEGAMYRFVLHAVRNALDTHNLIPAAKMRDSLPEQRASLHLGVSPTSQRITNWQELIRPQIPSSVEQRDRARMELTLPEAPVIERPSPTLSEPVATEPVLWQLQNKYILVPTEDGIMIVDQHAAHERVLYERAVARFNEGHTKSQQLLFPHTIQMTAGDAALANQLLPHLEQIGFSLKLFGSTTVIVDGVPVDVKPGNEATILQEVIDLFKEDEQNVKLEPREKLAKSYSCKAAIKAGDPLKFAEMKSLLDQLFGTQVPYTCPHGRPVIVNLSIAELDKRFGRTS
jgi:DNA mismatch repair protein MutL